MDVVCINQLDAVIGDVLHALLDLLRPLAFPFPIEQLDEALEIDGRHAELEKRAADDASVAAADRVLVRRFARREPCPTLLAPFA